MGSFVYVDIVILEGEWVLCIKGEIVQKKIYT